MVSETPVLSSERFLPDCQEVLDKTSSPRSIQILCGGI